VVVARSTPELMLAYLCLQSSGRDAAGDLALALHNGAIIAHLLGRQADAMRAPRRPARARLYAWEMTPLLYGQFMAYALYRARSCFRESAISAARRGAPSASTSRTASPSCGSTARRR